MSEEIKNTNMNDSAVNAEKDKKEPLNTKSKGYISAKKICYVAVFTALNVIMSMSVLSVPVPGGHIYLNDIIITLASLVLDPVSAFIAGGVGAFLGDLIFYPKAMFVSLVVRGVQTVAISLISGKKDKLAPLWRAIVAVCVGAIIMIAGYTFGRAFIYGTPAASIAKLPFQILQAAVGAIIGTFLLYATPIKRYALFVPRER